MAPPPDLLIYLNSGTLTGILLSALLQWYRQKKNGNNNIASRLELHGFIKRADLDAIVERFVKRADLDDIVRRNNLEGLTGKIGLLGQTVDRHEDEIDSLQESRAGFGEVMATQRHMLRQHAEDLADAIEKRIDLLEDTTARLDERMKPIERRIENR